ncbi:MAG TPA: cyclopropane-fatty-acyl-phospholipid synthase family protein [Methylophilaceae bacterium]|nr:cyclopropane-fatty-acyl-phospholipid synthase family protein [Methylophilaceae bacterium]
MLQKQLAQWVTNIREQVNLQARLVLWDGQYFDLGQFNAPLVTVHVKETSAIPYLLTPSMDKLGEAYVKGKIDFEGQLTDIISTGFDLAKGTVSHSNHLRRLSKYFTHTKQSDLQSIQFHYDLSNEFYQQWLDPNMVYSCAYFEHGYEDLETAQLKKIDHILTKLQVKPGDSLLDIGCGWGALVLRAAQKYGATCVGITLAQKQFELASERVKAAGLQDKVEIRLQDYRDVDGQFDKITSVGMFEHVGRRLLPKYFAHICDLLKDGGMVMNHGITSTDPNEADTNYGGGEFLDKYVFPNGELPHISLALHAMQEGGLEAIDVENLRRHYARTLNIWADNFEKNASVIKPLIDTEHYRTWRLYLAGCAYAFQQDQLAIYQIVGHKAGLHADSLNWSRRYMYQ